MKKLFNIFTASALLGACGMTKPTKKTKTVKTRTKRETIKKVKTEDTGSGSTWGGSSTRSVTKPSKKEEKVYNWGDGELVKIPWPATSKKEDKVVESPKIKIESITPPSLFGEKWEYISTKKPAYLTGESGQTEASKPAYLTGESGQTEASATTEGKLLESEGKLIEEFEDELVEITMPKEEDKVVEATPKKPAYLTGESGETSEAEQILDIFHAPLVSEDKVVKRVKKDVPVKSEAEQIEDIFNAPLVSEEVSKDSDLDEVADFYENQKYTELEKQAAKEADNFFEQKNEITDVFADQLYKQLEIKAQNAAKIYGDKMASKVKAAREAAENV